jgi:hypothetical protein
LADRRATIGLIALLVLTLSLVGCETREKASETPFSDVLPAWNGTIAELAPDDTVGWLFANVESLRDRDEFDAFLRNVAPQTNDALAHAVVEASQIFVGWTAYSDDSRLSIVRTNVPSPEVIESIRADESVTGLREATAPDGLTLWMDEDRWSLTAPAENILLVGPEEEVRAAANRLLQAEGDDQLSSVDGISLALDVSPQIRQLVVGRVDNSMFTRAFEPVERVEGTLNLEESLTVDGKILMARDGNPSLLATFLQVGWNRMATEAFTQWFKAAYAERLTSGLSIQAAEEGAKAVRLRYVLPSEDTQMWLDALSSENGETAEIADTEFPSDTSASDSPAEDDENPANGEGETEGSSTSSDNPEASPTSESPPSTSESASEQPRSPAAPRERPQVPSEEPAPSTDTPSNDAPTTLPP